MRSRVEMCERAVHCYRLSPLASCHHRHLLPMLGIASNWRVDLATRRFHDAFDEREVCFVDAARFELRLQIAHCRVVLCDDDDAARLAVKPMHDPRSFRAADIQVGTMREDRVDERAVMVSCRRMHDHPRGLVDDEQIGIFVQNIEWDFFGARCARPEQSRGIRWRDIDRDRLADLDAVTRFACDAVNANVRVVNQALDCRA